MAWPPRLRGWFLRRPTRSRAAYGAEFCSVLHLSAFQIFSLSAFQLRSSVRPSTVHWQAGNPLPVKTLATRHGCGPIPKPAPVFGERQNALSMKPQPIRLLVGDPKPTKSRSSLDYDYTTFGNKP